MLKFVGKQIEIYQAPYKKKLLISQSCCAQQRKYRYIYLKSIVFQINEIVFTILYT